MILRKLPESEKINSKIKKKEKQCIGKQNEMFNICIEKIKKREWGNGALVVYEQRVLVDFPL